MVWPTLFTIVSVVFFVSHNTSGICTLPTEAAAGLLSCAVRILRIQSAYKLGYRLTLLMGKMLCLKVWLNVFVTSMCSSHG